ncbi:MAG: hypothetical protein GY820_31335 [Gammaproteobacteria bacterium]|nr:hypothetical protein [Gammaproteobacteria bacterium]
MQAKFAISTQISSAAMGFQGEILTREKQGNPSVENFTEWLEFEVKPKTLRSPYL